MEQQWQQVLSRDARADGQFVYAVRSTHIYCRPTCPSRRPRRTNVDFFPQPAAAERAGFRACKRCRPNTEDTQATVIREACKFIDANLDSRVTLPRLAKHVGYSPFHLQRIFKKGLGITPQQYQASRRLASFKSDLRKSAKVVDAAYRSGYSSSSRVSENATPQLGMTPASYGKKGKGARIAFTVFDSELGKVLIAETSRGLCCVKIGSSSAELERELREEFSAAEIRRDDSALASHATAVRKCIAGQNTALRLPLDIRATTFQSQVWQALRQIPLGSVLEYSEVARTIGHPRAHRAVARACAANPVALIVPCHRVVPKSGQRGKDDGGYRWGRERKAALLKAERRS
jgi:AraC family transcriptional regulator, regulatory protein of adaptative response / methylated-DNA-[protein]-cysteine methyltransferase